MSSFLTAEQKAFFAENGYLVVAGVVDVAIIGAVTAEYAVLLDEIGADKVAAGELPPSFSQASFAEKYLQLLRSEESFFDRIDITLPLENAFPVDATMHAGPAVFALLTHEPLLDLVESILGPEIYSNPVQHVRLKPPRRLLPQRAGQNSYVGTTTWHQDHGALLDEANESEILTTWVAITDATEEMGCLCCIPGSHLKGTLTDHCPGKGIAAENYIPGRLLDTRRTVKLPVRRGAVILLHQYTEHAALNNKSETLRWSFDLRWNRTGQPTGRPAFPGFVARSRANPASQLRDPARWRQSWQEAKARILAGQYEGQIYNAARWLPNGQRDICA